jgi:hypothetical protein
MGANLLESLGKDRRALREFIAHSQALAPPSSEQERHLARTRRAALHDMYAHLPACQGRKAIQKAFALPCDHDSAVLER